ncbi:MAG: DUF4214 domain-containing protein [Desulfobacterales bacterium]|nr:MAG: DUF4214 domain-containing protein [Desulfobacterales bacterium]
MSLGEQAVRGLAYQIALEFLQSQEYILRQRSDPEFLEDLYNGILRRGAQKAEFEGWIGYMRAGMTREAMLQNFINSEEFQLRVQAIIDRMSSVGMVTLSAAEIAGPGGTLVYMGAEYTDEVEVPHQSLVGVIKDGKAYLYHPALGRVPLSEDTSRRAVAQFVMGADLQSKKSTPAAGLYRSVALEPGDAFDMKTRVHVSREGDNVRIVNKVNRWVAVKVFNGTDVQVYYLPPAARTLDSNMTRWVASDETVDLFKRVLAGRLRPGVADRSGAGARRQYHGHLLHHPGRIQAHSRYGGTFRVRRCRHRRIDELDRGRISRLYDPGRAHRKRMVQDSGAG